MYLVNTKKEIIDLTLDEYVTEDGEKIYRSEMLNNNPNYLWHTNGRIVKDEKIAYVTNLPEPYDESEKKLHLLQLMIIYIISMNL